MDPGGEATKIIAEVERQGVTISQVLLTHGHLDHVGAAAEVAAHFQVPIYGPEKKTLSGWKAYPHRAECLG